MMNENNPLAALSDAMADAASRAGAATVSVNARRRFPASGIAIAADLILTADHVIEREEDIRVVLPEGTALAASLVGRDPGSDLALLRLDQPLAKPAALAKEPARVGQIVLAVGRPTAEGFQASLGVITAMGGPVRTGRGGLLERFLRTDAIPYPGFSGGPLINGRGEVLGVNTSGVAHGVSLVIPIDLAGEAAQSLLKHGHVRRGYLGIRSQSVALPAAQQGQLGRDQASGLLLVGIEEGSPAEAGGLFMGDIIVAIAGRLVADADDLAAALVGEGVGKPVDVQCLRGGQVVTLAVTIGERK